jgi:NAD(P)-dependent dehydrogenase (short-subunit alcohol dehydrogenase family)
MLMFDSHGRVAAELAPYIITVNAICPGFFPTELTATSDEASYTTGTTTVVDGGYTCI